MTKKELENALSEVLLRLQKIEATTTTATTTTTTTTKNKPVRLLRFAYNNWDLRHLMKARRVKWNPKGKGWEFDGKVSREELGCNDYEIVEF